MKAIREFKPTYRVYFIDGGTAFFEVISKEDNLLSFLGRYCRGNQSLIVTPLSPILGRLPNNYRVSCN